MRKTLFLFFLLLLSSIAFSQNKIDSLLDAGFDKDQYENPKRAIENAERILQNKHITDKQKIQSYHLLNSAYSIMGENRKAIEYSFKAKDLADKFGDKVYSALALGSIGENYRKLNLYDEAIIYYTKAIEILDDKSVDAEEAKFLPLGFEYEIGNIEYLKENYRKALHHYNIAIDMVEKTPIKDQIDKDKVENLRSNFYLLRGHCYVDLKKIDSAEIAYNTVREIITRQNDKFMMVYLLKSYGDLNYAKGNYQSAIDSAKKAEELLFFDDEGFKASLYELLAKSYTETKNYPEFEKYHQLAENAEIQADKDINNATSTAFSETKKDLAEKISTQKKWKFFLGGALILLLVITTISISTIKRKSLKNKRLYEETIARIKEEKESEKSKANKIEKHANGTASISEEKERILLGKLNKFENSEKFTSKNITLPYLASQLDTNTSYLSEIIKTHKNKNFNTYINELKIKFIINKIQTDSTYHKYKTTTLADECGLPYSSFTSAFKSFTGISPSEFLKQSVRTKKEKTSI